MAFAILIAITLNFCGAVFPFLLPYVWVSRCPMRRARSGAALGSRLDPIVGVFFLGCMTYSHLFEALRRFFSSGDLLNGV